MAKFKLASQRLNQPQTRGLLSPGQISGRAAGTITRGPQIGTPRIKAPQIAPVPVQYTPTRPPQIQADEITTALIRGGEFTNTLEKQAFAYNQKQDQLVADYRVLEASGKLRDLYYGSLNEDGTISGGYANSTLLDASKGYGQFQSDVKRVLAESLEDLTPQQQLFAANQLHQKANTILSQGASHASSEQSKANEALVDQKFQQTSEDAALAIQTGNLPDIGAAEIALSRYTDPDERKRHTISWVESVLAQTYQAQGAFKMMELAGAINNSPILHSSNAVRKFLKAVSEQENTAETRRRAKIKFDQDQRDRTLKKNDEMVGSIVTDQIGPAIEDGTLPQLLDAAFKRYSSSEVAQTRLEAKIEDGIKQGWDNKRGLLDQDVEILSDYAKNIREQARNAPPILRDNILRKVDELELAELARDKEERQAVIDAASTKDKIKGTQLKENIQAYYENKLKLPKAAARKEAVLLRQQAVALNDASLITMIDRIESGIENPYAAEDLTNAYLSIEDYVADPTLVDGLDVSYDDKIAFSKTVNTVRDKRFLRHLKPAMKEIAQAYKLKEDRLGGFTFTEDFDGATKNELSALFNSTSGVFLELVEAYMRPDKGLSPAAAVKQAKNDILTDPAYTDNMPGIPDSDLNENNTKTYDDDHSKALRIYHIDKIPGLQGPSNVIEYVSNIKPEVDPRDPKWIAMERINEVFAYLERALDNATTEREIIRLKDQIYKHNRQSEYVKSLLPLVGIPRQPESGDENTTSEEQP